MASSKDASNRKRNTATANDGNNSSFSRLLDSATSNNNNKTTLRRRPSLFGQLDRPQRRTNNDTNDEPSSFSLASLTQESSMVCRKSSIGLESKKRSRNSLSGFSESSTSSASNGASRSLFGSLLATTVCNTQAVAETKDNNKSTTKASSSTAVSSSRTSLFGSVMQNVGQSGNGGDSSGNNIHNTPSKNKNNQLNAATPIAGRRKWPVFTPEQSRRGSAPLPFGSPGGRQMLDFVNTFASPFHNHSNSHSIFSTKSDHSSKGEQEWQNTSIHQGVNMDWSLPKSLHFDCFPVTIGNSLLKNKHSPEVKGLGMVKFLQSGCNTYNNKKDAEDAKKEGLAEWESGLLYWQHPAVHPSPFVVVDPVKTESKSFKANKNAEAIKQDEEDPFRKSLAHNKKKRRNSNLAEAQPLAEVGNILTTTGNNPPTSSLLQQQQNDFTRQRRLEWKQAFASLYWKWISKLQHLQNNSNNCSSDALVETLETTYFYAYGQDHVVLFWGMEESGTILPMILVTSSSAIFRDKLRHLEMENLCLMEAWNGHPKGAVFAEEMIQPAAQPTAATMKASSFNENTAASNNEGSGSRSDGPTSSAAALSLQSPTKETQNGTSKLLSPSHDSNSPFVKEELAALRRAQVFGETVGADVTVTIKKKTTTGPKLPSLASIPPLTVKGFDDCAVFFEAYLNMGSSCCVPTHEMMAKGKGACVASEDDQKTFWKGATAWQMPQDVPLLVCRGLGPFCNATIKSLTVRGTPHYPAQHQEPRTSSSPESNNHEYATVEVQGGPILPCAMKQLFWSLVQTMSADKKCDASSTCESARDGEDNDGEEALIGSHNLILRPVQQSSEANLEEQQSSKFGVIGSSLAYSLNQFPSKTKGSKNQPQSQVLGMAVWDILHPHAMAYKLEPAASSSLALSLLK